MDFHFCSFLYFGHARFIDRHQKSPSARVHILSQPNQLFLLLSNQTMHSSVKSIRNKINYANKRQTFDRKRSSMTPCGAGPLSLSNMMSACRQAKFTSCAHLTLVADLVFLRFLMRCPTSGGWSLVRKTKGRSGCLVLIRRATPRGVSF